MTIKKMNNPYYIFTIIKNTMRAKLNALRLLLNNEHAIHSAQHLITLNTL